jgi:hypothetical protein
MYILKNYKIKIYYIALLRQTITNLFQHFILYETKVRDYALFPFHFPINISVFYYTLCISVFTN